MIKLKQERHLFYSSELVVRSSELQFSQRNNREFKYLRIFLQIFDHCQILPQYRRSHYLNHQILIKILAMPNNQSNSIFSKILEASLAVDDRLNNQARPGYR